MIEHIVPSEVASVVSRGDDLLAWLYPEEAAQMCGAVDTRLREFTTARTCARMAIAKLGLPTAPILRGPWREPIWPRDVVGSITHCKGYCAAAVAKRRDILSIGIDAEPDEQLPPGVLEQVALAEERAWLATARPGVHWDRLLFSAKESVFKAWFPLDGLGWASSRRLSRFMRWSARSRSVCWFRRQPLLVAVLKFLPAASWCATDFS